MKLQGYILIRIVCALAIVYALDACNSGSDRKYKNEVTVDNISLADLNGNPIKLEDYKGKAVFLNFWATWCKPCIEEFHSIEKVRSQLKEDDLVYLCASSEEAQTIKDFASRQGYHLDFVQVLNSEELGVQSLPTTYIFDRRGVLKYSEHGAVDWADEKNIQIIKKIASLK